MLVSHTDLVRGQRGCGVPNCGSSVCGGGGCFAGGYGARGVGQWLADHPLITVGAVAAAIAIPLAVSNDDDSVPVEP